MDYPYLLGSKGFAGHLEAMPFRCTGQLTISSFSCWKAREAYVRHSAPLFLYFLIFHILGFVLFFTAAAPEVKKKNADSLALYEG